ncbi:MAG TPA: helix-turn-helix transcriptional regulator [Candidatus Binataceae bacterium]|nr:helix-turn-helix transcriptional regulator [Candidatus Binataceae bacterium]
MSNLNENEAERADRLLFLERLGKLAERVGGKAALAKLAGLSPTSIQNYFGTTEPPRPIILALASATKTSVGWLAGEPETEDNGLPQSFIRLPFFDLSLRKNLVYPLFNRHPEPEMGWRIFHRADLVGRVKMLSNRLFLARIYQARFTPLISTNDDVLVDGLLADDPTISPKLWEFPIDGEAIYFIGRGSKAALRKLRKRKEHIDVLDERGRIDFKVSLEGQDDFLFWGPVVWRGGAIQIQLP